METDLEKNREDILELMRSRWCDAYRGRLVCNIEALIGRMIARADEGAIDEDFRGIDGIPHLLRVAKHMLEIAENPPEIATILAALGHDWDRCVARARVARDLFPTTSSGYRAYKTASAVVSALEFCDNVVPHQVFERQEIQLARERIVFHEKGRDAETDLIDAADCFAFFYVPNLNAYYHREGEQGLRQKLRYQLLPRESKYYAQVVPRVRDTVNNEDLEESITPLLREFLRLM